MSPTGAPTTPETPARTGLGQAFCRSLVLKGFAALQRGTLTLHEGGQRHTFGGRERADLQAELTIRDGAAWRRIALGGSLGAAEAYLRGEWVSQDLPSLIRLFAANLAVADEMESTLSRLLNLPQALAHRLRRNSRQGSRRNIRDHYDLGNDFFALFLDPSLTYSCAWFDTPDTPLEAASIAKLDRVCRKLALGPNDRVVEIGSGWGSFALHAAGHYGCHVTTTTISDAQYEVASRRIAEAGLTERITLLKQDYRTLTGQFDKLVSIEMIEAVGADFMDDYFATLSRLLRPDGQLLIQAITMPEQRFAAYLRSVDYIQHYVFPGSALTSIGAMARAVGQATDLGFFHVEDMSAHYARTLQCWRDTFLARREAVLALGPYDERFIRLWDYYLAYCEAGFAERCTGVVQLVLTKPGCRRGPIELPLPAVASQETPSLAVV
ncbi:MAG: cyclopropane-fatty-acyl-phospholipid synthase family protein [Candidatus Sericytochromatia bacterium]|nr:cyclopropane-fatty-acyl-phospholipid synthase family protein [Candidatus Sericytochromatia bacterium]